MARRISQRSLSDEGFVDDSEEEESTQAPEAKEAKEAEQEPTEEGEEDSEEQTEPLTPSLLNFSAFWFRFGFIFCFARRLFDVGSIKTKSLGVNYGRELS